ncbi:tetratricopeptide repeat protein [Flavobacteriaceae bacterium 14752]|uniref:tetratricopeptide repeat protein n=1 Tax=Mesohalobacter salilacus TaxID=2491711 RepID=UPI000F642D23|nr:tetratricopeptide repeat protein [Flavobacteriaceae bacterium 14752]
MKFESNEDFDFPIEKFEHMLKTNNILFFDTDEFVEIVEHYIDMGKLALAKKALKLGLDQHPNYTDLKLLKAEIYIFEDKHAQAEELLKYLQKVDPENEEIYVLQANIYSKQDRHIEAIETLEYTLDFAIQPSEIYNLIGIEYLFMENFEKAKVSYMKCLDQDQNDFTALYNIIYCFDFLDQQEEAIAYLNQFLDKNPYCEIAWHQLGKLYFDIGEDKRALQAFDFAIYSDDYFVGAYLEKAKVLERLKRYNEAIENYKISNQLDDPTAYAYLRIGKCYMKLNNSQEAIKFYKKAVHEDPMMDKAWSALTEFHMGKKDYKTALSFVNKALNIDGENPHHWRNFSIINSELGDFEESKKGLQHALEFGNYEFENLIMQIDICVEEKKWKDALDTLNYAQEFYENHPEFMYRLAGVYYQLKKFDQALITFQKAYDVDKEYVFEIIDLFPEMTFHADYKSYFEL